MQIEIWTLNTCLKRFYWLSSRICLSQEILQFYLLIKVIQAQEYVQRINFNFLLTLIGIFVIMNEMVRI